MKVTTEKLPKSLLVFEIELEPTQVEKGLDRAARKISQRANIPGFRKGKAPRFIVENYFGREALLDEASEDLMNDAFRAALKETDIRPVGQPRIVSAEVNPFRFRVEVPVPPTVKLPDYRSIQVPLQVEPINDEDLEAAMDRLRDRHTVLQELEEPRPAQDGDQLTVRLESFANDEPLEPRDEGAEVAESQLVLEQGRIVDELYEGLIGANIGDKLEITAHMPADHANEQIRDQDVVFKVEIVGIQQRLLAEWDDLPTLEEFEGTLDDLRTRTRTELEDLARAASERKVLDTYIEQLVEQTEYDVPDVLIRESAEELLQEQVGRLSRYGVTLDQYLMYVGKERDEAVNELLPRGEERLKTTLALQELVQNENLSISREELEEEIGRIELEYAEDQRERVRQLLSTDMVSTVANTVLDKKLRTRLLEIAQGIAPAIFVADTDSPADETPASEPVVSSEQVEAGSTEP